MTKYAAALTKAHTDFLTDLFPGDGCLLSPEELAVFSIDASQEQAMPWAVVRPETREQVQAVLAWADRERMPIYGRARGTGRVGNAVPSLGGVVVSMLRMNRIIDVNASDFVAVAQPGVVTADLQAACAAKHLFYPPDPASVKMSTLGGNIATCAGGLKAVKYGVTRDWVLGIEAVLPGGTLLRMGGRSHKDVVGLDLKRLFAGSNGTLGLFTELTVKLIPLPEAATSVLVGFADMTSSMDGAKAVFQAGVLPAACEFMDGPTLQAIRMGDTIPVANSAQAALLFMVDGTPEGVDAEVGRLVAALQSANPVSVDVGSGAEAEALWDVRRSISPASFRLKPDKMAEDIAVPRGQVGVAVAAAHDIGREHGLQVLCFGHLGDGNIHVGIMFDRSIPSEVERAHAAKVAVFHMALKLGGTISGEHGTGLTKASFVHEQLTEEERQMMAGVRRVFDPHGIMNPGKGL
ncbi:FAD-binding protein [Pseudodesulfovibrio sp. JC047]|uniref:FAD-binding oxidoreductase n=1 Tax=Pseudodesulfovibrio sp. JC047 TaxID=2683199 RepID=UPI0013D81C25|nr:FAD-linked oxidase C-terminal domain-containing protein [Pseudodesulfovibrio sp. JC047]NDV20454.1 FAD-binding protein [Pseudodesulfovibrio sp. JC047]